MLYDLQVMMFDGLCVALLVQYVDSGLLQYKQAEKKEMLGDQLSHLGHVIG